MNKSGAWTLDDEGSCGFMEPDWRSGGAPSIFRDLKEIMAGFETPFAQLRGRIESAILKHTRAEAAGVVMFETGGYRAARDCPHMPGLPSLEQPVQLALERRQPLAASVSSSFGVRRQMLVAPVMAADAAIGFTWALGRDANSRASDDDLEMLEFLAALIARSQKPASVFTQTPDARNKAAGFRALIQNIKDYAIFTVDRRGIVTDWTEGASQVLGYTAAEAIGMDFRRFFTDEDVRAREPEKELDEAAAESRAERESWRVHRSGEKIWVNAISSAIRDENGAVVGFVKVSRDLSERRRIEMERERLEARLAAELEDMTHLHEVSMRLFETGEFSHMLEQILEATIGLQSADLGTIQLYDSAADQLAIVAHKGFPDDLLRRQEVVARDNQSASSRAFRTGRRVIVHDVELESADRAVALAAGFRAMQCTPILSRDGSVKGMLTTHFRAPHTPSSRDLRLTDLYMRLASELITRAEDAIELRRARQLAESANQAKSRFLATASHDLRQPLQSLSLLSGTLRRMATNPYLRDAVEQQQLAIASMSGLLNALLDISKLDSGAVQPSLQHIELGDLFDQMRIEFGALAAKKGIVLEIPACTQFVHSDPTLLGQILRNLVSNALRYTQSGSVTLAAAADQDQVEIIVRDTGIGIAETHLERIFEEFYQVDVRPNSVREGHGLGLSIVQRTAAMLGHPLTLESALGSGSVFKITVPVGRPVIKSETADDSDAPKAGGKATHVLLIDDDPGVLKATRLLLEVEGYRVTAGKTLADARAAVAANPDLHLLISDYHLSDGESGRAAIEIVRAALPRIEVILMTGDTSSGLRHVSPTDRICVASKPIEADALLGLMKRLLTHDGAAPGK